MLLLEAERVAEPWDEPRPVRVRGWRRFCNERLLVFVLATTAYLAVAVYFVLGHGIIFGDALSRVANAQYVIDSRDRHLAAIGFVWNPLPSLVLVPFIPLRAVWPDLIRTGFVGDVSTALFMAGAVGLVRGTLQDLGVGRVARLALTLCFAANPMIVLYASNGMSEAPLLFFIALAARALTAWLGAGSTRSLVTLGFALAGGYLTRYEAIAPALAVTFLVAVVSAARATGPWRERRTAGLANAGIAALPFAFVFVGWAVLSRVIVKQWFPTLQSEYGNTAQVGHSRQFIEDVGGHTVVARGSYVLQQIVGLEPALAVLLVLALLVLVLRRDLRVMAPVAVAGAVLAFDSFAFLTGSSFGWLRFQIAAIPLAVMLAGVVASGWRNRWLRAFVVCLVFALTAPGIVTAADAMANRKLGREEAAVVRAAVRPDSLTPAERTNLGRFDVLRDVAAYVDGQHLKDGAVLTDAAFSFGVLLASRHPQTFLITPDQDFQPAVADPVTFGVQYLLIPDHSGASYDALNVAYPDAYAHGVLGAQLVHEWNGQGGPDWRLYRLADGPTSAG
jgi:hypothetical protein